MQDDDDDDEGDGEKREKESEKIITDDVKLLIQILFALMVVQEKFLPVFDAQIQRILLFIMEVKIKWTF